MKNTQKCILLQLIILKPVMAFVKFSVPCADADLVEGYDEYAIFLRLQNLRLRDPKSRLTQNETYQHSTSMYNISNVLHHYLSPM